MHSIMMNVSTWREIFDFETIQSLKLTGKGMMTILRKNFGYEGERVVHGRNVFWQMDQSYAACAIKYSRFTKIRFGNEDKPRAHAENFDEADERIVEVHLAKFQVQKHWNWFKKFSINQDLLTQKTIDSILKDFRLF